MVPTRSHRFALPFLVAAFSLAGAGCSSDPNEASPFDRFDAEKSTLEVSSATSVADGSTTVTITATARDKDNSPIGGLTIRYTASGTGNTLVQPSSPTNPAGVATGTLASTDPGTKTISAVAEYQGQTRSFLATRTVTFNPASPVATQLAFTVQPTTIQAGGTITPAVQVTLQDANGNTVTDASAPVSLSLAANPGSATLSGTLAVTPVSGVATFSDLSLDKIGNGYTLTASASGLTSATSSSFDVTAGPPTELVITTQPSNASAGSSIAPSIVVELRDAGGNVATQSSAMVTAAIGTNPAGGTLSGTTSVAATAGVATFTDLRIDKAGAGYTLTFSATGLPSATSNTFTVNPGNPATLAFVAQPSNAAAGNNIAPPVQVEVLDAQGNRVTGATTSVTIAIGNNPAAGTLLGTTVQAPTSGVSAFADLRIDKAGAGYTLTASATGLTGATSNAFNIVSGGATTFMVTGLADPSTAGAMQSVTVTALDQFQNVATGYTGTVQFESSDGQAVLPANFQFPAGDNGVHTFTNGVILRSAGSQSVTVRDSTTTNISGAQTVVVNPGAPNKLAFTTQPSSASAGVAMPAVVVTVQDEFGNTATGATNSIAMAIGTNPGGGTLTGTSTVAATAGVATFNDLFIDKVGAGYTLAASSTGLTGATSSAFTVNPGPATKLVITTQPQNATAGATLAAVVLEVRDAQDNLVTGATDNVSLSIDQGATLMGTTSKAASGGVVSFDNLAVQRASTGYVLSAAATGLTSATSSAFDIVAGEATQLLVTTSPQTVTAGAAFDVAVTAVDAFNNTDRSYTGTVAFTAPDHSTQFPPTLPGNYTFVPGDSGARTFTGATIFRDDGSHELTVTDTRATAPPTGSAQLTVTAAAPSVLTFTQQPANTTSQTQFTVEVSIFDAFLNPAPSATNQVTLAIANNAGSPAGALSGNAMVDAINGVATFSGMSIDRAGAGYTLSAAASGLTGATSNAFNVDHGTASQLVFTAAPSNHTAGDPVSATVEVRDAVGNLVITASNSISLALTNSGAFSGASTTTASAENGIALFDNLAVTSAGTGFQLTASSTGLTMGSSTSFDVTAGSATHFFVTAPTNVTAGAPFEVTVTALDEFNNIDHQYSGMVGFSSTTDTKVNPASDFPTNYTFVPANDDGTHIFEATTDTTKLKTAGAQNLTVTDQAMESITGSATINVSAAAVDQVAFVQNPTNANGGATISPAVTVQITDQFMNPVTTATNMVSLAILNNPNTGTLSGTTTRAAVAGVATFNDLSIDKQGTGYTLRATLDSPANTADSTAFDINTGPAAMLAFTQAPPATIDADAAFNVTVQVQDLGGNPITSSTDAITLSLNNVATSTVTFGPTAPTSGEVTFSSIQLQTAGEYTATATSGALTQATAMFSVNPLAATRLVLATNTNSVTAGAFGAIDLTVSATDPFGNIDPTFTGMVSFSVDVSGTGDALPASYTFVPGDLGVRMFQGETILSKAPAQTITVSGGTFTQSDGANQQTYLVAPGDPSALVFTAQPTTTLENAVINSPTGVKVTVKDAFENDATQANQMVTLAIGTNPSAGTLGGTTTATPVDGVATFDTLTIDKAGADYTLTASYPSVSMGTSSTFDIQAVPAAGDLVITEMMHSPSVTGGTWFELQNRSGKPLQLNGLFAELGTGETTEVLSGSQGLADKAFFVIGSSVATVSVNVTYYPSNGTPPTFPLAPGATLMIKQGSTVIDSVDTSRSVSDNPGGSPTTLNFPAAVTDQSLSLSYRAVGASANDNPWYWCNDSTPTPGAVNTVACNVNLDPDGVVDFCRVEVSDLPTDLDTRQTADILSQFFEAGAANDVDPGATNKYHDGNDGYPNVFGEIGYGTTTDSPETNWTWTPATFRAGYVELDPFQNNDEMVGGLKVTSTSNANGETVFYGFRYRLFNPDTDAFGPYVYCAKGSIGSPTIAAPGTPAMASDYPSVTVYQATQQIEAVRAAANGTISQLVRGAVVTHIKPAIGSEADGAGFFVQAAKDGPALFVAVDPSTLTPTPPGIGDRVSFTVSGVATAFGDIKYATGVMDNTIAILPGINDVAIFVKDVTNATDLQSNVASYEHELITVTGATVVTEFGSAGSGFVSAQINTPGITGNEDLLLRVPTSIATDPSRDLGPGCVVDINQTPMWKFFTDAQVSAWDVSFINVQSCPSPKIVSAVASDATTVVVTFDRMIGSAPTAAFGFDNGLTVSAAVISGKQVTLTTSTQTPLQTYTLTLDADGGGVTDTRSTAVQLNGTDNVAMFTFVPLAILRVNEFNANISLGCDLVELRVVSGGTIKDFVFKERVTTVLTFPDMEVQTNDYIIVHYDRNDANCRPSAVDCPNEETTSKNAAPSSVCSRNYDTAFDFWVTRDGMIASDNVLTIYDSTGTIQDAVFAADDPTGTAAGDSETQAAAVAAAGEWTQVGGGVPAGGFIDDDFAAHAVQDLNGTSNTRPPVCPGSTSIQRIDDNDTNTKDDWSDAFDCTWGANNAGQSDF